MKNQHQQSNALSTHLSHKQWLVAAIITLIAKTLHAPLVKLIWGATCNKNVIKQRCGHYNHPHSLRSCLYQGKRISKNGRSACKTRRKVIDTRNPQWYSGRENNRGEYPGPGHKQSPSHPLLRWPPHQSNSRRMVISSLISDVTTTNPSAAKTYIPSPFSWWEQWEWVSCWN